MRTCRINHFFYKSFLFLTVVLLLMLAGIQEVHAAASEFYQVDSISLQNPKYVQIDDVNSDGYNDLLTINGGNLDETVQPRLSVCLSKGNGTFEPPVDYCLGRTFIITPTQFMVEDIDGDGNLDVAVAVRKYESNDKVMILLGNGDGTFQNPLEFTVGESPTDVVAADFNQDGVMDLAVGQYQTNTVAVLLGTADTFGFSAPAYYQTGNYSESIAYGDLDHDGYFDLAVSNYTDDNISILLNDGSGAFGEPVNYSVPHNSEVICADFDADNNSDLAVGGRHGVYIFMSNGDGTLADPVSYGLSDDRYEKSVVARDFNGDGNLDLAALNNENQSSSNGAPELSVWEGNGDGTFKTEINWDFPGDNSFNPGHLSSGDFNNDGKPDLAIVHFLQAMQYVSVMINNTEGALHAVAYNGNEHTEGTAPEDEGIYQEGDTVTVLGNSGSLIKSGYKFIGWNTRPDGNGTTYAAGDTFSIGTENVILYAKWVPAYTVDYDGNGNTGGTVPTDNTLYEEGDSITVPDNSGSLIKSGYKFIGWNTRSDGNGTTYAAGDTFPIGAENVMLYAKWVPAYTVTYDGNGNTGGAVPTDSTLYEKEDPVTVLGNTGSLAKTNYNFDGWNTQSGGNGADYAAGDIFSMGEENVILYAQWVEKPTYTVTFIGWNDEVWKTETVYEGGSATAPVVTDEPEYEFCEWDTGFSNITGDLTVKARYWCEFKMISIVNGEEIEESSNDILNGESAPLFLGIPEKEGYAYSGCYGDSTCTTLFDINNPINEPTNMYLKYIEKFEEPAVYLADICIGTGMVSGGGTYAEGDTVTVSAEPKCGFYFTRWTKDIGFWMGGTVVSSDATYTFTMGTEDRLLVANFEPSPICNVTYNGNGSTDGTVPTDNRDYVSGDSVTVLDNTGNITKEGYIFAGWNTRADGNGTNYAAGDTFVMGINDITLYTKWVKTSIVTVAADPSEGGTVSGGGTYNEGESVTVTASVYDGYSFTNWTESSSEVSINESYTFNMGTEDRILVANFEKAVPETVPIAKDPVPEQTVRTSSTISFVASDIAEDEDGDNITITEIRTAPAITIATADLDNGTVNVTGISEGSTSVTVTVSDGKDTVAVTVPITVTANDIAVTGVTLDRDTLSLTEETSGQLTATVVPADATNKNVTWSSDDSKIATVDGAGKVTAVLEGTVIITVTTADGGYYDTCTVTVTKEAVTGAAISPDTGSFDMYSPDDIQTTITWNSTSAVTDITVGGTSIGADNYDITDIDGDSATLSILKEYLAMQPTGSLVLTIAFDTGEAAEITIDISDFTPPWNSPVSTTYDLAIPADISTTITWNSAQKVTDVVYNSTNLTSGTDYTVTENVLTIKDSYLSGLVPSVNDMLVFDIYFDAGGPATLTVNVVENYPSDDADLSDLTVEGGTISGFGADVTSYNVELPHGTSPGSVAALVNATTNDPAAQVSITQASALPGSATVTVTAEDGTIKVYTIYFTIGTAPTVTVTSIAVTGTGGGSSLQVGNTLQMLADVLPANATDKSVAWSIESGSNASINADGLLTATVAGSVTVRATANDGSGVYGEKTVTITTAPVTTYTVTASVGSGGSISPSGAISVASGGSQTFIITPGSGYRISSVTVDGVGQGAITTYTFTNVTADQTIHATFNRTSGGGTPSTPSTPTAPDYEVEVKEENSTETMLLPVTVDKDTETASIDLGSQNIILDGTVITIPPIPGTGTYSVGIPVPDLSSNDSQGTLTLNTDTGNITVPSNMLTDVADADGNKAQITIGQGDKDNLPDDVKSAIGDKPLIQLTLSIDSKQTEWSNPNAPVTVTIPYTPTADELKNPESIVIWYIDGSGNVVSVPNGRYDPVTGTVNFFTTHFSDYAVAYVHKTFSDLGGVEWARKAIEVMASKGITNGTGDGTTFSPSVNITRADFMVLLIKILGLTADFTENFDDIQSGAYYYDAIGIAKKLGIAAGSGNNRFNPTENISRQDMMVLVARTLEKYQGLKAADNSTVLDKFSDKGDISEYAVNSLATLVDAGLIAGSGDKLNPRSFTTRAEVAVFFYKIYNKYPKASVITASTVSRLRLSKGSTLPVQTADYV